MKALVVCFTDLSRDPRASRQIRWLGNAGFTVSTFGLAPSSIPVHRHYSCGHEQKKSWLHKAASAVRLLFRFYDRHYWSRPVIKMGKKVFENEVRESFDLIVVNDFEPLPLIEKYKGKAKVLLDAHEYTPEEFIDRFLWRFFLQDYVNWLCHTNIGKVDAMTAVCDGIGSKYRDAFGIEKPFTLTNAVAYQKVEPTDVQKNSIQIIHHGLGAPSRNIEGMIAMADYLDERFHLHFILVPGCTKFIGKIQNKNQNHPRIHFHSPVALDKIVPYTNQYDIGLYLLPPVNTNYLFGLPNKLFEYIQARLALAIGPSPEMKKIVEKYQCGLVSSDFSPQSLAKLLNSLSGEDIIMMKKQAHQAAEELNAEKNEQIFQQAVNKALFI